MSTTLMVLCAATAALIAIATSSVVAVSLPLLDRIGERLRPRDRARMWLGVGALPLALGTLVVTATLLPAWSFGADHCLSHDLYHHAASHVHVCPHHGNYAGGPVMVGLALLVGLSGLVGFVAFVRSASLSRRTARDLQAASTLNGDLHVFSSPEPQAFVLGMLRPTIHVSDALLALGDRLVAPVLAHERAHARARDPLWRAVMPLVSALHLPFVRTGVARRLATAQEMTADAVAAQHLGDRVRVAESLIALARQRMHASTGLAFTHGDINARVRELVEPRPAQSWVLAVLSTVPSAVFATVLVAPERVHHAVESVLGKLI